eukprot:SAG31_NODE_35043_length_326_cov_2.955947_1_plen_20_part_01
MLRLYFLSVHVYTVYLKVYR